MGFEAGPDLLCSTGSVILHFRGRFVLFFQVPHLNWLLLLVCEY